MIKKKIVSEYVSYGHPDKIADQIADCILDEIIKEDPDARAGIEVMVKDNVVVLGGEVHFNGMIDYESCVRSVFDDLNFPELESNKIKIINLIGQQSAEIHNGVDKDGDVNAGDQGFMVGFASNETKDFMPLGAYLARTICNAVVNEWYGPDVKSQVIVNYDENGNALSIDSILVSAMHYDSLEAIRRNVTKLIMENKVGIDEDIFERFFEGRYVEIDVNPCGEWRVGGPVSDCGVTGRKLVVDAYGGYCNIGGGSASGKDLSKVDRSGAYIARYIAKNIVASGFSDTAKVTLSYMIGVAEPCSVDIELNRNNDEKHINALKTYIKEHVNLTPGGIIEFFDPTVPRYYMTSRNGHYGFEGDWRRPWEKLDIADDIKKLI